jgi:structural maintenance of chromosome 2
MAPGKVDLALNMVEYPQDVANAMVFAFGNTLVCSDPETAKRVTFSRDVNARCVTLQGDIYDPSGTLSGGAPPQSNGMLLKVQEWRSAEDAFQEAQNTLQELERQQHANGQLREKWRSLMRDLEMKEHEMGLLTAQVEGSNAAQVRLTLLPSYQLADSQMFLYHSWPLKSRGCVRHARSAKLQSRQR